MIRSHARLLPAVLFVLAAACAEQQAPIDRVQPNYFDKSFFVGSNFLDAKDDPEFYSQATLTDVGYGATQDGLFTSTYAQPLTRVKWSITEDMLIARLAYERIASSDGKGLGVGTHDGIVVAAFNIQSHFDIQREYNPSTGEQLNVIGENTSDRKWFDRQFIRVDWSRNLSTDNYDFDTLSQLGAYGGITYEPFAYTVLDPTAADAPHFDKEGGYLDVTNKVMATPDLVDASIWGLGAIPACWFDADFAGGGAPSAACNAMELTIRQSFLKVVDHDYEPADWDGFRFQSYGAFTTDRYGYARNYGMTDTLWHRFINRYNLWNRSHVYSDPATLTGPVACYTTGTTPPGSDPHRDTDGDGTEDECAAVGNGSRCDTFKQRCTLPYRQRQEQTLAWYYTQGSNQEFFEPTREAAHEWDVALRSAVVTARYAECVRTKGTDCKTTYPVYNGQQDDNGDAIALAREVDDCREGRAYQGQDCFALADSLAAKRGYSPGVVWLSKQPEMIVLCHSPVQANDPAACGGPRLPATTTAAQCHAAGLADDKATLALCNQALIVRNGDLRFHQVNTMAMPQSNSPWGIMVDAHDPLTGEKVAASINVWSHVTDLWSEGIVDTARYIKGELTTADVTEGTYVRDWSSAAEAANTNGSLPKMTRSVREEYLANLLQRTPSEIRNSGTKLKSLPFYNELRKLAVEAKDIQADGELVSTSRVMYDARRKRAKDTQTEAALMTATMQSFAGNAGKMSSEMVTELASPLRGANPAVMRDLRQRRELMLAERGACIMNEAPAPQATADLANIFEAKFGAFNPQASKADQAAHAARIQKFLAARAHYAVVTHEMGHSIGLRHNFVSSSDAFNYRPQYWQLRTDNGTNASACTQLDPTGACVGPRYFDPLTGNERDNLIAMFSNSSTMDYPGEATQDTLGLGAYDFAAARMFYGDVVSVFADPSFKSGTPRGQGAMDKMDGFGGIIGLTFKLGDDTIHYSQLQQNYDLIGNCQSVNPEDFKPGSWNDATQGLFHPVLDALIVKANGEYSRCRQQPVDYVSWTQMKSATAAQGGSASTSNNIDPDGRLRFPYGFATDRWADLGNLSVYRHDNGADPYELFDFLETQQEIGHIFDNYRRNRQTFSVRSASSRTLSRYNEKLRDAAKGLGLLRNVYKDFGAAQGYDFETLWPSVATEFFADNLLASGLGFDHFARQMSRPQSGPHYSEGTGLTRVLRSASDAAGNPTATVMNVPNGATGYFGNVSFGGRPLENALAGNKGEYDSDYTLNAGSYYDKAWAPMLMTESVDNFISASRRDFLDARYRSVSVADLFPEGYRRWLGNNLTGDDVLKGVRVRSSAAGTPTVDADKYPTTGLAYTSWTGVTAEVCFTEATTLTCSATPPANSVIVDPQVGWEQQKFLIAYTLLYLPENQQQEWMNQLGIWEMGADTDPQFPNRIELHLPNGKIYVAKTFGTETLLGKKVQKGISARILEWANTLLAQAYVTTPGDDLDGDGSPDWVVPALVNGQPVVQYDARIKVVNPDGTLSNTGRPGCNPTDNSTCTCTSNKACIELSAYEEVPLFMRQAMRDYGLAEPSMKGIY